MNNDEFYKKVKDKKESNQKETVHYLKNVDFLGNLTQYPYQEVTQQARKLLGAVAVTMAMVIMADKAQAIYVDILKDVSLYYLGWVFAEKKLLVPKMLGETANQFSSFLFGKPLKVFKNAIDFSSPKINEKLIYNNLAVVLKDKGEYFEKNNISIEERAQIWSKEIRSCLQNFDEPVNINEIKDKNLKNILVSFMVLAVVKDMPDELKQIKKNDIHGFIDSIQNHDEESINKYINKIHMTEEAISDFRLIGLSDIANKLERRENDRER
jgi:hypothetical protein